MTIEDRTFQMVTNSSAGRTDEPAIDGVRRILAESGEVTVSIIDEGDVLAEILAGGRSVPVFVGGDGTVHYGLQAVRRHDYRGPVGIIPLGTGNDFARNCGLPLDWAKAARVVAHGEAHTVAAARSSLDRWVANNAHVGLGVAAAERAEPFKPYLRALSYRRQPWSRVLVMAVSGCGPWSTDMTCLMAEPWLRSCCSGRAPEEASIS